MFLRFPSTSCPVPPFSLHFLSCSTVFTPHLIIFLRIHPRIFLTFYMYSLNYLASPHSLPSDLAPYSLTSYPGPPYLLLFLSCSSVFASLLILLLRIRFSPYPAPPYSLLFLSCFSVFTSLLIQLLHIRFSSYPAPPYSLIFLSYSSMGILLIILFSHIL